ncbi:PREDICTED: trafficking protein particle complex subunit 4-like isoform X1 [Nicotiana attenuata]|nr:PREDICTED: trafficking protein particle complex subunit 4-like isoform X1 [Nicotiana attenuata]
MSNLPINYAKYPYLPLKLGCSFRQTTRTVLSLTSDSNARVRPTKRKDLIKMAAIYSLYIINKSGGLIFYKDYGSAGRMDTNDTLRLASLWHSMHAISQQLSPIPGCSGIELLQADTFDLNCFQSLTGTKVFVVSEPGTLHMEYLLKYVYELYTDYVLKNPFYEMEMPIRCELFDINLTQAVQKDRVALLGR